MKEILRSIVILIALIAFGNLILLIPDYANGEWVSYGDTGSLFSVLLGLIPIIILILLDIDAINVYSLPFSDIFDHCMGYVIYILVIISSLVWSSFDSALTNAISFIMAIFIFIFPLYLIYDEFVRVKFRVKNIFINRYLFVAVCGGLIVLSIGAAYLLALFDTYLPGDIFLSLGETEIMDGFITIPTFYLISIVGTLIYIVYYALTSFVASTLKPKKQYKYATYSSPKSTTTAPTSTKKSSVVKCCKYCRYYGFARDAYGQERLCCKRYGVETHEYSSCDGFEE